MKEELEKLLIDKQRYMFEYMGPPPSGVPLMPISFGVECGDGWFNILSDLLDDIANIDTNKEIRVMQIKEKFGGLRFYIDGLSNETADKIYDRINLAETESFITCEYCGLLGKERPGGWIKTLCDCCDSQRKKWKQE